MEYVKVNKDNVVECWEYFEGYLQEFKERNYSDAKYEDFENWVENNLVKCPCCGNIVHEDYIDSSALNTDDICQDCKGNGYYE